MRFWAGFVLGILLCITVPIGILWLGWIDMAALPKPGLIETRLGELALDGWLHRTAPRNQNAVANDPTAVASGLEHYREGCIGCHGAPNVQPVAKGFHPDPSSLERDDTQEMSDGELFWIIRNGVRMTAMPAFSPAHTDGQIWQIVAFLRHLPHLTPDERSKLRLKPDSGNPEP